MTQKNNGKLNPAITFDDVFKDMEHWRNHKNEYEGSGIPEVIWRKVFELERTGCYTATQLKRMLGLNSQQYRTKQAALINPVASGPNKQRIPESNAATTPKEDASQEPIFCEAFVSPDAQPQVPALTPDNTKKAKKTKAVIKQLKSTQQQPECYLDRSTIIVEYLRPDGHRLKIHTTTQSIHQVMRSFGEEMESQQ